MLSASSGATDAISFITFGVFTSAMSGNTVVLGIAIGQQSWPLGVNAGLAFIAYMLGVGVSSSLSQSRRALPPLIAAQMTLLGVFAVLWLTHGPTDLRRGLIVLAALAMGVQATVAQSLRLSGIITVVFTGTLTAIARAIAQRMLGRSSALSDDTKRQIVSWACYAAGAIVASAIQLRTNLAVLLPFAASLAALLVACDYARSSGGSHST